MEQWAAATGGPDTVMTETIHHNAYLYIYSLNQAPAFFIAVFKSKCLYFSNRYTDYVHNHQHVYMAINRVENFLNLL